MCAKPKKVFLRLTVALLTFSTSVALTAMWVLPNFQKVSSPSVPTAPDTNKRDNTTLRDGWKRIEMRGKVALMVPQDMKQIEPFGHYLRHVEAYGNDRVSIMIFYDLLVPEVMTESQKESLYSCEQYPAVLDDPSYRESSVEIDRKKATIGISKPFSDHRIVASLCFPLADNVKVPLYVVAICNDDLTLETAQQIFHSIRFKD